MSEVQRRRAGQDEFSILRTATGTALDERRTDVQMYLPSQHLAREEDTHRVAVKWEVPVAALCSRTMIHVIGLGASQQGGCLRPSEQVRRVLSLYSKD